MAIPSPVKYTALHYKHLALGATMTDDQGWQRPEQYSPPEEEVQAVRAGVGLCDISPVGKLDIEGKEIIPVLERVFSPGVMPGVGQVQRTVLTNTEGVRVAAGSCCRLRSDQALIMIPPGTIAAVEQMFESYVGAANGCVHLTNLTSALAAVQLVGPCSQELLCKLTALNLSPLQFSDLTCVQGNLAKVQALIVRADVGSELAYEIYCGRAYGEYLWDTLMDAAQEFGAVPFGLAARRLLGVEE